jgi:hypothetical protein
VRYYVVAADHVEIAIGVCHDVLEGIDESSAAELGRRAR